jgi:hypothetical protein
LQALLFLQEIDGTFFRVSATKRLGRTRRAKSRDDKRVSRLGELRGMPRTCASGSEIEDLTTTQRQRMRKVENEAGASRNDVAARRISAPDPDAQA